MRLMAALLVTGAAAVGPAAAESNVVSESGVGARLSSGPDGELILSYIDRTGDTPTLQFRRITDSDIGDPETVSAGSNWFVNWADFPSVVPLSESRWAAHWLVRQPAGGYAYDVFISLSGDAGKTWGEPFLLHYDDTPTEHGFVSLYPHGDSLGAIWLDGREMSPGEGHASHGAGSMTLRSARIDESGQFQRSEVVDVRTCECCDTDVAVTSKGPVAVYRNRDEDEIRDIFITRFQDDTWTEPVAVHTDGWRITGCPVNGPSIAANGDRVSVTWFTAASGSGMVNIAWSDDAGGSFAAPVTLDAVSVVGYVGSAMQRDGAVVASWMCQRGDVYQVCYRQVAPDGTMTPIRSIEDSMVASRLTIPQVAVMGDNIYFAWAQATDKKNGHQIMLTSVTVNELVRRQELGGFKRLSAP